MLDQIKSSLRWGPLLGVVPISATITPLIKEGLNSTFWGVVLGATFSTLGALAGQSVCNRVIDYIGSLQLKAAIEKIEKTAAARELLINAKNITRDNVGELKISVTSNSRFGGETTSHGEIYISSDLTEESMITTLLFELANATQAERFEEVELDAARKLISQDEYAMQMEIIEAKSTKIAMEVLNRAKQENGKDWNSINPRKYWEMGVTLKDDQALWDWVQTNLPEHVQAYRDQYERLPFITRIRRV